MKTYQDLVAVNEKNSEKDRMAFVQAAISEFKSSPEYRTAADADQYYRHLNPTIMRAQRIIHDVLGQRVQDPFSPNNKVPCRYFFYFVNQAVQYLLGNGVSFSKNIKKEKDPETGKETVVDQTKERLGDMFDHDLQRLTAQALCGGVAFGYWNNDHLEIYSLAGGDNMAAFVPLYDEENGALRAGIRFWQIDDNKPLRAALFEEDGVTEYIKKKGEEMKPMSKKRPYIEKVATSEASGEVVYDGENYPGFPVIPLYNVCHQSELVGGKNSIDAYDLMMSGLINNVDEGNLLYWVIKNAGGMNDEDDMKFVERLKTIHVAHTEGDEDIVPAQLNQNVTPNQTALELLRNQMFEDFMALDIKNIASGAATATQIEAAYEPMNIKSNMLEAQVTEFILNLLSLLGIDDYPSYQRDTLVNKDEEMRTLLSAAEHLSDEYVTKKALTILGDIDSFSDVMSQKLREDTSRYETPKQTENEEEETVSEAETMEE